MTPSSDGTVRKSGTTKLRRSRRAPFVTPPPFWIFLVALCWPVCRGFMASWGHVDTHSRAATGSSLVLLDKTTTNWFGAGDTVVVVEDVYLKNGKNLKGTQGVVLETWESCDVDPACCCSEQVESDMAVRVNFSSGPGEETYDMEGLTYYFAETELKKAT